MIKLNFKVSEETHSQIKKQAEKESRSVSGMSRKILEDYFRFSNSLDTIDIFQKRLRYGQTETGEKIANFIDEIKK